MSGAEYKDNFPQTEMNLVHKLHRTSVVAAEDETFSSSKNGRLCFLLPETAKRWNRSRLIASVALSAFNCRNTRKQQNNRFGEPEQYHAITNSENKFRATYLFQHFSGQRIDCRIRILFPFKQKFPKLFFRYETISVDIPGRKQGSCE